MFANQNLEEELFQLILFDMIHIILILGRHQCII